MFNTDVSKLLRKARGWITTNKGSIVDCCDKHTRELVNEAIEEAIYRSCNDGHIYLVYSYKFPAVVVLGDPIFKRLAHKATLVFYALPQLSGRPIKFWDHLGGRAKPDSTTENS
jgi:hypothetical protein